MADDTLPSPAAQVAAGDRQAQLPSPGTVLQDKYRLEAILGQGGYGRVYRATDLGTGRAVAVKMLKGTQAKLVERFRREARAIASLQSPHTLSLYDYGDHAGALYMVTEFVDGEDLADRLGRGPLSEAELVHILRQVLDSLREAHAHGILHRDIKPANVRLFEYAGDPLRVKVLDFGLARSLDDAEARLTTTGAVVGTPRYMSPEQLTGGPLTPATDIFSLGLVALECLLGRDHPALTQIGERLVGVRIADDAGVSPALRDLINRMIATDVDVRLPSARAVLDALRPETRAEPSPPAATPPPTSPPPGPERAHPRRPAMPAPAPATRGARRAWLLGALGTLGTLVAASVWSRAPESTAAPPPARNVQALLAAPSSPEAVPATVGPPPRTGARCTLPFTGTGYLQESGHALDAQRWYAYIPAGIDPNAAHPLVVLLHQQGHTGEILLDHGGFKEVADRYGLILVAPTETDFAAWAPQHAHIGKVGFMIEEVSRQICIDAQRVLAVGHAGGGGVARGLACRGFVHAVATHAYSESPGEKFCEDWSTPHLFMFPTDSGYEPLRGGKTCSGATRLSLQETEASWLAALQCQRAAEPSLIRGDSICWRHSCSAAPFEVCQIKGGRGWPGTPERPHIVRLNDCDGPTPTFPVAEHIGEFFARTVLAHPAQ